MIKGKSIRNNANLTDVIVDSISITGSLVIKGDSTLSSTTIAFLYVDNYIKITNNQSSKRELISLADDFDLVDYQDRTLGFKHKTANTLSIHYETSDNTNYIYTFQNKNGTLAMLDDIPKYYSHCLTLEGEQGLQKIKTRINVISKKYNPASTPVELRNLIAKPSINNEYIVTEWGGYATGWEARNDIGTSGSAFSGYTLLTLNATTKLPVIYLQYIYSVVMPDNKLVPFFPSNDGYDSAGFAIFTITSVHDSVNPIN